MSQDSANFVVRDRRRFHADGSLRDDAPDMPETQANEEVPSPSIPQAAPTQTENLTKTDVSSKKYPVEFTQFLMSFVTSIQMALGMIPHPATGRPEVNLQSATQTIDILEMLRDKTMGNLTSEESTMLDQLLYEVKMLFVEVKQKISQTPKAS